MTAIPRPGSVSFEDRVTKAVPYDWGFGSTPRTANLRDALYWKAAVIKDFVNVLMGQGKMEFRRGIRIDVDRARIVTDAFRETEGQPRVLRFARMVERLCEGMPIFMKPGELIIGDPNGAPDEVRWYPETNVDWVTEAVTSGGFSKMVSEEERKEIVEDICEYWRDKSAAARIKASLPMEMAPMLTGYATLVCNVWEEGRVIQAYDWEMLFRQGLQARVQAVEANLRNLDDRVTEMNPSEYLEKKYNWEAMARCGRAMIRYAERLAGLARQQAEEARDEARRKELEDLAAILEWVPANPPRTFYECLQFHWIIETTAHYMARWGNGAGTRIDQVWWPYYEADMRAGRISREQALEFVECLFLKIQELGAPLEWPVSFTGGSGGEVFYTANICGTSPEGGDASNDLSCIVMEALCNLRLTQPPIALRYHRSISPDVVERAIDLGRVGLGHPAYFNEELLEKWGLMRGWSPEEARNTQASACVANNIMGKTVAATGLIEIGGVNLVKTLEEVLNANEQEVESGAIVLASGKDVREMKSADELMDAVLKRVGFYTEVGVVSWNIAQQVLMDHKPDPCNSFLLLEPMERGIDLTRINKEHDTWPNLIPFGAVNVADSLAAIQRLVFGEKKYSMDDLLVALKANWAGYEEMRQDFLNAPKYGNDDDFADEWAVKFQTKLAEAVGGVNDAWGHSVTMDGSTATAYVTQGMTCGASPDGRRAMEPLGDGTRSPMAGSDKIGPTAVLNSAGKIPYMHTELMNQRFMPQFMEGDNRELFAEYLKEWHDKGTIPHVQFNVVSSDQLRDAQVHPTQHSNLIVRVAGYSAHFVDLPLPTQESIINRTEQSFT
jgi:benzylsuccinate synthase